jgi:chorismate mutase
MPIRGIRGATVAAANTSEAIRAATRELLLALAEANGFHPDDLASILFTVSPDLTADYPAWAARQLGWVEVPMLCAQEIAVPDGMARCIRVLVHWNTEKRPDEVRHVYLHAAVKLRPDRAPANPARV